MNWSLPFARRPPSGEAAPDDVRPEDAVDHGDADDRPYSEDHYNHHHHDHPPADDDAASVGDAGSVDDAYAASVTSSVRAHVYEAGMQFHAYRSRGGGGGDDDGDGDGGRYGDGGTATATGKLYALPNDEVEQNRDDMKHAMIVSLMHGKLFHAPVHERLQAGGHVYDLGTGTGIWAIDVAELYPRSVVRGVDLSPIQPEYVPDNVFFAVDDFEEPWPYRAGHFDLVHMRMTLWAVDDRAALLRRIWTHLKPGGFVEIQEIVPQMRCDDGTLPPAAVAANALRDFTRYVSRGLRQSRQLSGDFFTGPSSRGGGGGGGGERSSGPPAATSVFDFAEDDDDAAYPRMLEADLRAAGFRGAVTTTHKCPLGAWPDDPNLQRCGLLLRNSLLEGVRGWAWRPLGTTAGGLGWTRTQIEIFLIDVRKAIVDTTVHAYFPLQVTYAQKPE